MCIQIDNTRGGHMHGVNGSAQSVFPATWGPELVQSRFVTQVAQLVLELVQVFPTLGVRPHAKWLCFCNASESSKPHDDTEMFCIQGASQ